MFSAPSEGPSRLARVGSEMQRAEFQRRGRRLQMLMVPVTCTSLHSCLLALCIGAALRCGCTVGDIGLEDLCLLPCLSPVEPGLLPREDGQAPPEAEPGGPEHEKSQINHHDLAR